MRRQWAACLLSFALMLGSAHPALAAGSTCEASSISLVRHAEKADPADPDTALSELGLRRAEALVASMNGRPLDRILATHLRRTQHTVLPLARERGLLIEVAFAKDFDGLLQRLKALGCGQHLLVAGHSNTLPALMRGLGLGSAAEMEEDDYGEVFVLHFGGGNTNAVPRLETFRFDPQPTTAVE